MRRSSPAVGSSAPAHGSAPIGRLASLGGSGSIRALAPVGRCASLGGPDPADASAPVGRCASLGGPDPAGASAPVFASAPSSGSVEGSSAGDRGSVTPLVIGMMVCLLLLTAGVTAAGSAFMAGQRLQRLCDGAVAAAVGAVNPNRTSSAGVSVADPVAAANEYLRVRGPDVGAVITLGAQTVNARCSNEAEITFGALFGVSTLSRTVTATSQPIRRENALGDPSLSLQRTAQGPEGTQI